jgi:mono/diheme cytochrome c family protein
MRALTRAIAVVIAAVVVTGIAVAYSMASRGLGTRVAPHPVEAMAARAMRYLATPGAARRLSNPVDATPQVIEEGLAHFADHCASCHANDGSGGSAMGRSFYPPAPDMRISPTQDLTDGELFSIIENGVRLTGMPAWGTGTPEGEHASWALVHFIRRLPRLTPAEIVRMEALNPKSEAEFREAEEARRFLAGQ